MATGAELFRALSHGTAAAEVEATLDRLVSKQVLRETKTPRGVRFYVQALRQTEIEEQAAIALAEEQFGGRLANAARLLLFLVHKHQPDALADLAVFAESALAAEA